ncbi:MAG: hypothetical protein BWY11_00044 [Firmicutes bacterium ADurb.Bin182]|nr:MAG: hypothetical protein BWY11_00044 [Firmicutes bacterium ADurb.Bin182]
MIERAERRQILAYHGSLFRRLVKDALLDNVGDIFGTDERLLIAVFHLEQRVGHVMEGRVFKQDLLNAADEAQVGGLDDFAQLTHEADVLHQLVVLASFQVVEQLVHDNEIALIAVLPGKCRHHRHERVFVICDVPDIGELIGDAAASQILFNIACDNCTKRRFGAAYLNAQHFKLTGD